MAKKKTKRKTKKKRKATTKDAVVSCRFPPDRLAELDAYVLRMEEDNPGPNWTRSSAATNLILLGIKAPSGHRLEVRTDDQDAWSKFGVEFTKEAATSFAKKILLPGMFYRIIRASDRKTVAIGVIREESK